MPSETDPLLPSYPQAPEISQHNRQYNYSSEVNYNGAGVIETSHAPETWKQDDDLENDRSRGGDEDDNSNTFANGMARTFRSVLVVIWLVMFIALGLSFLRARDETPEAPLPPGYRRPTASPTYTHPPTKKIIEERVKDVLTSTPLIDGHDDLAIFIRYQYKNDITSDKFKQDFENGTMPMNVDLARLRSGMVGGAFWSAWVGCPPNASFDITDSNYASAAAHTLEQIDLLKRLQKQYSKDFTSPTAGHTVEDRSEDESGRERMLARWHATGSFFGPISIEGLHQILPSAPMSTLRHYYSLGVRMATLTWNCHNAFADAALVSETLFSPPDVVNGVFRPDEGAITNQGRLVLKEMNRLGMIIDISHTSYWTQKAVLGKNKDGKRISRAPVVFSHSSAYSVCPHPRNVKDDILDLVPETKSLVMVNFSPGFVSCNPSSEDSENLNLHGEPHFSLPDFYEKNNTLHQVARHIIYIGDRIGYDYVGLGSDFDGMDKTPRGLEGVDKFPDLVAELLKMGVSDENANKIVGGNLLRVWKDVDDVSAQMKKEGVPPGLDDASGY